MLFLASESNVEVVFVLGEPESYNIFDVLKTCKHKTSKMASVPHAVHAAFKVRDHLSGGPPGQESKSERFAFSAKAMSSTETQLNQPVQYNGKLMNSIWGLYNRYSVHNIKSHIAFDKY